MFKRRESLFLTAVAMLTLCAATSVLAAEAPGESPHTVTAVSYTHLTLPTTPYV